MGETWTHMGREQQDRFIKHMQARPSPFPFPWDKQRLRLMQARPSPFFPSLSHLWHAIGAVKLDQASIKAVLKGQVKEAIKRLRFGFGPWFPLTCYTCLVRGLRL